MKPTKSDIERAKSIVDIVLHDHCEGNDSIPAIAMILAKRRVRCKKRWEDLTHKQRIYRLTHAGLDN